MFTLKNKLRVSLEVLLLIDLATILPLQAKTTESDSLVKTIANEDEFLAIIDKCSPSIVMGSMEHCPHCKNITPVFENLSKKHKNISFIKANGITTKMHEHVKRESKEEFKIPGYPAFVFINNKHIVSVLIGGNPELLEPAINDFAMEIKKSGDHKKQKTKNEKSNNNSTKKEKNKF